MAEVASRSERSGSHSSLGFLAVLLLVIGSFAGYSLTHNPPSSSSQQQTTQRECESPVPPAPSYNQTVFRNGTVVTEGWLEVLTMPVGSAGQVCVQYSGFKFGSEYNGQVSSGVYWTNNSDGELAPTSLVNATAVPSQISVSTYVNETVAYVINSSEGSRGLYELGLFEFCPGIPLAVGYQGKELNATDYAWKGSTPTTWSRLGNFYSCGVIFLESSIVGLTNIHAVYLPVLNRYTMTYNITGSSVISYNPTPTVQNVTFSLQVQTFASPLEVGLSLNNSDLVRFSADPELTRVPLNDSCSWYPNDTEALNGEEGIPFDQLGAGNMAIDAQSILIPEYSTVTYSLSIRLANLSQAYYYALMPIISFAIPGYSPVLQSIAAFYPVNAGQSDFAENTAQTLSGSCT